MLAHVHVQAVRVQVVQMRVQVPDLITFPRVTRVLDVGAEYPESRLAVTAWRPSFELRRVVRLALGWREGWTLRASSAHWAVVYS